MIAFIAVTLAVVVSVIIALIVQARREHRHADAEDAWWDEVIGELNRMPPPEAGGYVPRHGVNEPWGDVYDEDELVPLGV